MNDNEVNELVKKISLEFFGRPFIHNASFNYRLRSTGGRYLLYNHNIELNKKAFDIYGIEELIDIIKHELCHYHLHIQGEGYKHRDMSFKKLLNDVNGTRYSKILVKNKRTPYLYKIICKNCNQIYYRKRKINIKERRCGKCFGALKLFYLKDEYIDK